MATCVDGAKDHFNEPLAHLSRLHLLTSQIEIALARLAYGSAYLAVHISLPYLYVVRECLEKTAMTAQHHTQTQALSLAPLCLRL